MKRMSNTRKTKILRAIANGITMSEAVKKFHLSSATYYRLKNELHGKKEFTCNGQKYNSLSTPTDSAPPAMLGVAPAVEELKAEIRMYRAKLGELLVDKFLGE